MPSIQEAQKELEKWEKRLANLEENTPMIKKVFPEFLHERQMILKQMQAAKFEMENALANKVSELPKEEPKPAPQPAFAPEEKKKWLSHYYTDLVKRGMITGSEAKKLQNRKEI